MPKYPLFSFFSLSVPKVGRTVITHVLSPDARVYAELTVTRTKEDSFLIITGSGVELHDFRLVPPTVL